MSSARASEAREVLTKAETVLREDGHETNADVIAELREEFYPAPETVTVGQREYKRHASAWMRGPFPVADIDSEYGTWLDRIASDARVLAELRDENTQLKREVDWITERASSARIAANTFERERDRATADRDAGLRVLAEKEARIAELEQRYSRVVREHEALHDSLEQAESVLEQRITERDAALRALEEKEMRAVSAETALRDLVQLREEREAQSKRIDALLGAPAPASASEPRSAATPIPLGAVVSTTEYDYEFDRLSRQWECMQGDPPVGRPVDAEVEALCDLAYRIQHPVATRETVERVAYAMHDEDVRRGWMEHEWSTCSPAVRARKLQLAIAALSAAGCTVQEAT